MRLTIMSKVLRLSTFGLCVRRSGIIINEGRGDDVALSGSLGLKRKRTSALV